MTRSRVLDWTIGALGMLLLLAVTAVVLWWVVSDPATGTHATPTAPVAEPPVPDPPADLGKHDIWLGDVDVRADIIVLPESSLVDVEAQGHGARSGPDGVVVDRLAVQATIPFADVAAELGGDTRVSPATGGQARIERSVEVLGRQIRVVATGTVEARDGLLVVEPRSVDVGGPDALSRATAAIVRRFVTIEQPVDGLPKNLVLQDVTVQDNGFRADLSGQDVVLGDGES